MYESRNATIEQRRPAAVAHGLDADDGAHAGKVRFANPNSKFGMLARRDRDFPSQQLLHAHMSLDESSSAGVLTAFVARRVGPKTAILQEAARSARLLRSVMRPRFPTLLLANQMAVEQLGATGLAGSWDEARELTLGPEVRPWLLARIQRADSTATLPLSWSTCRSESDAGCTESPYLWKLCALTQTPFERTLFLDVDLFVLWPPLVQSLLRSTLALADVAMPLDVGRFFEPWASTPVPPLCSCMIAYGNATSAVRQLFLGAARRLIEHMHRRTRQGDQEMIWFEWTYVQHSLRVFPLPEEYYCPGVQLLRDNSSRAEWLNSWQGSHGTERGRYRCKALHAHGYTEDQLARMRGARLRERALL